jgi:serine/threonine protein kinase, bacterial
VTDLAAPAPPAARLPAPDGPTAALPPPGYDLVARPEGGDVASAGQRFGSQYVLGEQLGRGAMGRVVRARQVDGGPDVAVKLLRDDISADSALLSRFLTEKQVLESLHNPHVVRVLDLVVDGGRVGIVMELVEGGDLRRLLTGPLPEEQVRMLGGQLAQGLAAAHDASVVHRDLKPENVLVVSGPPQLHVRLTDFGVSRLVGASATSVSALVGTPTYMAPECSDGSGVGPAADVYALGVLLYEAVGGRPPFTADSVMALLRAHADAAPTRPPGASDPLWTLLGRMLEKEPAARPTAAQVVDILGDGSMPPRVDLLPAPTNRSQPTLVPQPDRTAADPPDAATILRPVPPAVPPAPATRSRTGRRALLAAAVLLAIGVPGAWATGLVPGTRAERTPQASPTATGPALQATSPAPTTTGPTSSATTTAPTTAPTSGSPTGSVVPAATVTVTTAPKTTAASGGKATTTTTSRRPAPVTTSSGSIAISGGPGGSTVRQCEYFSGRATLRAGTTLAVTMTNLDNGRPDVFLELVAGYENPAALATWRGHQYFGEGDSSVSQRFRVSLVAVPLKDARAADAAASAAGNDQPLHDLAPRGTVLASLQVTRVPGPGVPAGCLLF